MKFHWAKRVKCTSKSSGLHQWERGRMLRVHMARGYLQRNHSMTAVVQHKRHQMVSSRLHTSPYEQCLLRLHAHMSSAYLTTCSTIVHSPVLFRPPCTARYVSVQVSHYMQPFLVNARSLLRRVYVHHKSLQSCSVQTSLHYTYS